MKSIISILFAIFALSVQGYISDHNYYFFGIMMPGYVTLGANTGNPPYGRFLLTFNPSSSQLKFQIASSLPLVGDVGLFGPSRCWNPQTSSPYSQDSANCIYNTGPLLKKLATGRTVKVGDTDPDLTYQVFNGEVSLSDQEIEMLFNSELYIQMNTLTPSLDGKTYTNKPYLRGSVYPWDIGVFGDQMLFLLSFGANNGEFDKARITKTTNTGLGWILYNPTSLSFQFELFHTLEKPGTLLLNCTGTGVVNLGNGQNPFANTQTLTADQATILSELTVSQHCYLVLTSAEFPSGELFAWPAQPSLFQSVLTGKGAGVVSAYFASSMINFDYGTKTLSIQTKTNVTLATVTSFQVVAKNGTLICNLLTTTATLPTRTYCLLNATWIPELEQQNINLKISTTANPTGELLGVVDYNSAVGSPEGLSTGAKVGIAFGVIGGVLIIVAIIVGVVFLKKKSNSKI